MMYGRRLWSVMLAGALCVTAVSCGKTGTEQSKKKDETAVSDEMKSTSRQAYEEGSEAIDFFCETMGVEKEALNLIFNFKSVTGDYCYDIGVPEKPELTGTYIFTDGYANTENPYGERWLLAKKVTAKEKEERNLEKELGYACNDDLYEEVCTEKEKDPDAVQLSIDESTVKKYNEKRLGTDSIWECWNGYIDKEDHFAVSYYGDTSGWKTGYFDGKNWKMKQHAAFGDEEYYHYAAGAGLLWNFDGKRLIAGDQTGKTRYDFTMAEWDKANHLEEERKVEGYNIVPLTKKKAIFNLNLYDQDRVMSYIVDLKTRKAEKSFHQALYGCYYDGDFYHFDTNKNTLEIIDLKTGETKEKLDYSAISEGAPESITYLNYDGEMQGFVEVEESKGEETISYCVNPNTGEVCAYIPFHVSERAFRVKPIVPNINF